MPRTQPLPTYDVAELTPKKLLQIATNYGIVTTMVEILYLKHRGLSTMSAAPPREYGELNEH